MMQHTGPNEITVSDRALTAQQREFVREYIRNGANAAAACQIAYPVTKNPHKLGWQVFKLPHVQSAIRRAQQERIMGEGATKAVGLLISIMDDTAMPPQVRRMAARDMLEAAKFIGKAQDKSDNGDKPLTDLTKAELAERLAALLAPEGPPELEGSARDITPDEAPGSTGLDEPSA